MSVNLATVFTEKENHKHIIHICKIHKNAEFHVIKKSALKRKLQDTKTQKEIIIIEIKVWKMFLILKKINTTNSLTFINFI